MNHRTSFVRVATALGLTALVAGSACARPGEETGAGAGDASAPVRIGVPGAFSGASGSLGEAIKQGLELKRDEINAAGGILGGRQIELVYRDHEAVPDKAVTNVRELIERERVVALVGESSTGPAQAEAPIVAQLGVPWVVTISTGTKVTQQAAPNPVFRVSLVDHDQTLVAVEGVAGKYQKIAIMSDTSGYGQGGRTDLLDALGKRGIAPVADETYKVGDTDMTPQIARIRAAGADVIVNWGLGAEAAQIRRSMTQVGYDVPMMGSWGLSMPNYPELAGPLADGTLVVQAFSFDRGGDKAKKVLDAYKARYGTDQIRFPNGVANSYDGLGLMAAAIDKAGSTEKEKIVAALLDVTHDGLIKRYDKPWTEQNHEALGQADMFITRIDGGRFVPVEKG